MIIASILKKCLKGILYIFTLPVLLVILAFYGTAGVFIFIFEGIKAIVYFFTGRNLFGDFPEDIRAKEIMSGTAVTSVEINNAPSQPNIVNNQPTVPPTNDLYITQPDDYNTTVIETIDDTEIETSEDIEIGDNNE